MIHLPFFSCIFIFGMAVSTVAQNINVTGTVFDEKGDPLIGATIVLQGTSVGTTSDFNGSYQITAPPNGTVVFSFVGYENQVISINNRSIIDVIMPFDVAELGEVVIVSLGIEREKKALAYSVTEVSGEHFVEARENNIADALAGRVAGVNVSNIASGPAGSSRVIIRGNKSLASNNQPLYVVDGIAINTYSSFGQAGMWGGADEGDNMSSINPDDIESITVLKGASATALYGSRAANGVINITTKKGRSKKGIGVELNMNYVLETINNLSDLQKEYGSGGFVGGIASKPTTLTQAYDWGDDSWGPMLDGSSVIQFDGVSRPYAYAGDNWDRYYQTGGQLTNNIALTGGNDKQTFRFSVSDLRGTSVLPNSGFDRTNVSLSTNSEFGAKIRLSAKVAYSYEKAQNRPRLSDSPANGIQAVWRIPPNINVNDYKGDPEKIGAIPPDVDENNLAVWGKSVGEEFQQAAFPWGQNPWWSAYQFSNTDKRDRVIASGELTFDITDFLYIRGRIGMDWSTRRDQFITPQGTGYQKSGSISEAEVRARLTEMQCFIGFNKTYGPVSVNAVVGGHRARGFQEIISANGLGFNIPFFHAINNAILRNYGYGFIQGGENALFGSVEIGYNNYLYLTATGRNDWYSVLNPQNNDVFYPSAGMSFVFTEILSTSPTWLSFGKVRASWAQVGSVTIAPYQTHLTYTLRPESHLGRPLASFSQALGRNGNLPNPGLVPLQSKELELGVDLRFFHNRFGIDVTYYSQESSKDIVNATISRASGFSSTAVNLGKMKNNGLEVLITGSPVQGNLTWNVGLNFARNDNEVISLAEGLDELNLEEPRTRTVRIKHIVGQPFAAITGFVQQKAPDGQLVYNPNGTPVRSEGFEIIGQSVADWTGGINNSLTFKQFYLDFLIDFKIGGDLYSGTNVRLTQWGLHKQTLQGREGKEPVTVSGVTQTGTDSNGNPVYESFTKTLTPQEAQIYWLQVGESVQDHFIYDASFSKLRQLSLGYHFPKSLLSKMPFDDLTLSFVGRNLLILYSDLENVDPESTYSNTNSQGLDYFGFPAIRSFGFNLKATF